MKLHPLLAVVSAALVLSVTSAQAEDPAWKNSYQLETAGKYKDAITALDLVPANSPDAELKAIRRGWLNYMLGSFNDSIREYRLAIDRNGKSVEARLGVILPLMAQKRWREAEQNARATLDIAPNNYLALLRLTIAQEAQQNWASMEKTTVTMTTAYPTDATAYVYLARAKAWLNKKDEAITAYSAALARDTTNLEARAYIEKK